MKLFFIDGQKKGESFELSPPGASIGRELDNDIVLEGEGESRYHSKLEADGTDWKLKDLGSTNGTKHNGTKLTPNEFAPLKEGDTIVIGKQTMLFAEKLPDNIDDILKANTTEEKDEKAEQKDEKKEDSPAPSIIAIKPPSPSDVTVPDVDPVQKDDIDAKSSESFSDFFGDKEQEKKDDATAFSESTDFFGKTKQNLPEMSKEGKKKHAGLIFYVAVIAVAVILVSIFIMFEKDKDISTANDPQKAVKKRTGSPLLIRYEKQVTSSDPTINIYRYVMEIKDGKVTITIDDVRSQYKEKLSRLVGEEEITVLEDKIRETNFMITEQPQIGIPVANKDKSQILTIAYGREMNTIKVKNTHAPKSFVDTTRYLEDFSSDVLKIPPISLTPEERKRAGLSAYRKAKQHFDNYQAKEENLRIAIQNFNIAIENLRGFKYLEEYNLADEYKSDALLILEKEVNQHFANSRILLNKKEYKKLKEELLSIMAKVDSGSNNYKKAKTALIDVEKVIKRKKRN